MDYSHHLNVFPLYGESFYIQDLDAVEDMSINVDLTLPQSDVTMRWDLRISGSPHPEFEQELVSRLESVYVPLLVRNEVVSKITDIVERSLHESTRVVSVGVLAIIKLYSNGNQAEEEEEDEDEGEGEGEGILYDLETISTESTSCLLKALETVRIIEGKEVCTVCLEEFTVGSEAAKLPCSHVFHCGCLRRWLEERDTCPLCRYGPRMVNP